MSSADFLKRKQLLSNVNITMDIALALDQFPGIPAFQHRSGNMEVLTQEARDHLFNKDHILLKPVMLNQVKEWSMIRSLDAVILIRTNGHATMISCNAIVDHGHNGFVQVSEVDKQNGTKVRFVFTRKLNTHSSLHFSLFKEEAEEEKEEEKEEEGCCQMFAGFTKEEQKRAVTQTACSNYRRSLHEDFQRVLCASKGDLLDMFTRSWTGGLPSISSPHKYTYGDEVKTGVCTFTVLDVKINMEQSLVKNSHLSDYYSDQSGKQEKQGLKEFLNDGKSLYSSTGVVVPAESAYSNLRNSALDPNTAILCGSRCEGLDCPYCRTLHQVEKEKKYFFVSGCELLVTCSVKIDFKHDLISNQEMPIELKFMLPAVDPLAAIRISGDNKESTLNPTNIAITSAENKADGQDYYKAVENGTMAGVPDSRKLSTVIHTMFVDPGKFIGQQVKRNKTKRLKLWKHKLPNAVFNQQLAELLAQEEYSPVVEPETVDSVIKHARWLIKKKVHAAIDNDNLTMSTTMGVVRHTNGNLFVSLDGNLMVYELMKRMQNGIINAADTVGIPHRAHTALSKKRKMERILHKISCDLRIQLNDPKGKENKNKLEKKYKSLLKRFPGENGSVKVEAMQKTFALIMSDKKGRQFLWFLAYISELMKNQSQNVDAMKSPSRKLRAWRLVLWWACFWLKFEVSITRVIETVILRMYRRCDDVDRSRHIQMIHSEIGDELGHMRWSAEDCSADDRKRYMETFMHIEDSSNHQLTALMRLKSVEDTGIAMQHLLYLIRAIQEPDWMIERHNIRTPNYEGLFRHHIRATTQDLMSALDGEYDTTILQKAKQRWEVSTNKTYGEKLYRIVSLIPGDNSSNNTAKKQGQAPHIAAPGSTTLINTKACGRISMNNEDVRGVVATDAPKKPKNAPYEGSPLPGTTSSICQFTMISVLLVALYERCKKASVGGGGRGAADSSSSMEGSDYRDNEDSDSEVPNFNDDDSVSYSASVNFNQDSSDDEKMQQVEEEEEETPEVFLPTEWQDAVVECLDALAELTDDELPFTNEMARSMFSNEDSDSYEQKSNLGKAQKALHALGARMFEFLFVAFIKRNNDPERFFKLDGKLCSDFVQRITFRSSTPPSIQRFKTFIITQLGGSDIDGKNWMDPDSFVLTVNSVVAGRLPRAHAWFVWAAGQITRISSLKWFCNSVSHQLRDQATGEKYHTFATIIFPMIFSRSGMMTREILSFADQKIVMASFNATRLMQLAAEPGKLQEVETAIFQKCATDIKTRLHTATGTQCSFGHCPNNCESLNTSMSRHRLQVKMNAVINNMVLKREGIRYVSSTVVHSGCDFDGMQYVKTTAAATEHENPELGKQFFVILSGLYRGFMSFVMRASTARQRYTLGSNVLNAKARFGTGGLGTKAGLEVRSLMNSEADIPKEERLADLPLVLSDVVVAANSSRLRSMLKSKDSKKNPNPFVVQGPMLNLSMLNNNTEIVTYARDNSLDAIGLVQNVPSRVLAPTGLPQAVVVPIRQSPANHDISKQLGQWVTHVDPQMLSHLIPFPGHSDIHIAAVGSTFTRTKACLVSVSGENNFISRLPPTFGDQLVVVGVDLTNVHISPEQLASGHVVVWVSVVARAVTWALDNLTRSVTTATIIDIQEANDEAEAEEEEEVKEEEKVQGRERNEGGRNYAFSNELYNWIRMKPHVQIQTATKIPTHLDLEELMIQNQKDYGLVVGKINATVIDTSYELRRTMVCVPDDEQEEPIQTNKKNQKKSESKSKDTLDLVRAHSKSHVVDASNRVPEEAVGIIPEVVHKRWISAIDMQVLAHAHHLIKFSSDGGVPYAEADGSPIICSSLERSREPPHEFKLSFKIKNEMHHKVIQLPPTHSTTWSIQAFATMNETKAKIFSTHTTLQQLKSKDSTLFTFVNDKKAMTKLNEAWKGGKGPELSKLVVLLQLNVQKQKPQRKQPSNNNNNNKKKAEFKSDIMQMYPWLLKMDAQPVVVVVSPVLVDLKIQGPEAGQKTQPGYHDELRFSAPLEETKDEIRNRPTIEMDTGTTLCYPVLTQPDVDAVKRGIVADPSHTVVVKGAYGVGNVYATALSKMDTAKVNNFKTVRKDKTAYDPTTNLPVPGVSNSIGLLPTLSNPTGVSELRPLFKCSVCSKCRIIGTIRNDIGQNPTCWNQGCEDIAPVEVEIPPTLLLGMVVGETTTLKFQQEEVEDANGNVELRDPKPRLYSDMHSQYSSAQAQPSTMLADIANPGNSIEWE